MSHYTSCELEIKDQEAFIEALLENWSQARGTTLTREMIEIHDEPVNLKGYTGDTREQKANIIIRKKHVGGSSNDIGWRIKDGVATEFISDFDRSYYSKEWSGKVRQRYAATVTKKAFKKKGYRVVEEVVDGKVQITAKKSVFVG